MSGELNPMRPVATTLTDQTPVYEQYLTGTRNDWQKVYDAISSKDMSGVCGEIDIAINGKDFEEEIEIHIILPEQLETVIVASIKSQVALTYGVVRRLECSCGKVNCCIRGESE